MVVPYGNTLRSEICQIMGVTDMLYRLALLEYVTLHSCVKSVIIAREYEMISECKDFTAVS